MFIIVNVTKLNAFFYKAYIKKFSANNKHKYNYKIFPMGIVIYMNHSAKLKNNNAWVSQDKAIYFKIMVPWLN